LTGPAGSPVGDPPVAVPDRLRLTAAEELWAIPMGLDGGTEPLSAIGTALTPRAALEQVMLAALLRPPCLVSFSGGVDSSAVLALATDVARREGLAPPIPATNRFPGLDEADESRWQEQVVAHLGLDDWIRLEWRDELDMLGSTATAVLERHGVLAPFNAHFHHPLLARAAGGSLLTGIGGDELFGAVHRATAGHVLFGGRRPRAGDLPALAFGLAPRRLRTAVMAARHRGFHGFAWIRHGARRRLTWADAAWDSGQPLRWDRSLREWWWPSRMLQCCLASMRALAGDFDVHTDSPLAAPEVLAACARTGGAVGLGHRPRALRGILGDLLPDAVFGRASKASFNAAFWSGAAGEFAARWDGRGVDPHSVDVAALRAEWAKPRPDAHSFALLHRAWLASAADRVV